MSSALKFRALAGILVAVSMATLLALWWFAIPAGPAGNSQNSKSTVTTLEREEQRSNSALQLKAQPSTAQASVTTPLEAVAANSDSLRGSELDGAFEFDAAGRLQLNLELRRRFDYLLSRHGERSIEAMTHDLENAIANLSESQKAQIRTEFQRYLDLQRAIDAASPSLRGIELKAQLEILKSLRHTHLGHELAEAFFGLEEARADYQLERLRILNQAGFSEPERQQQLARLRQSASPALALELDATDQAESDVLVAPLEPDAERAARMQALAQERADWARRIAEYRRHSAQLQSLPAEERERARRSWLNAHFNEQEQRRIEALESLGQLDASLGP
jgi:lipase chaperone LimK